MDFLHLVLYNYAVFFNMSLIYINFFKKVMIVHIVHVFSCGIMGIAKS